MYNLLKIFTLSIILFLCSCSQGSGNHDKPNALYRTNDNYTSGGIEDGTHEATVIYHNIHSGTRSEYHLNVEVEDNQLKCIYWPNGGTLDESHFDAPDISDGSASFISDRGYGYSVYIDD